jgi:hypothetical protein
VRRARTTPISDDGNGRFPAIVGKRAFRTTSHGTGKRSIRPSGTAPFRAGAWCGDSISSLASQVSKLAGSCRAMKDTRSTRARTSPLVFAPLWLGTIVVPTAQRVKVPLSKCAQGVPVSRKWITHRAK